VIDVDHQWDPINRACHYARNGLRVISLIGKQAWRTGWYDLGSTNVSDVVQDFEEAIRKAGSPERVWVGWPAGADGYTALDIDAPEKVGPQLQAVLDAGGCAVNPTSKPGRYHAIWLTPEGMLVSNSTARFPEQGWGEVRGFHGQIVIAGPDRPGLDAAELGKATPFPRPEWLSDFVEAGASATASEVAEFLAAHTSNEAPRRLEVIVGYGADEGWRAARHDRAMLTLGWAMRDARIGLIPAGEAVARLRKQFLDAVAGDTQRAREHPHPERDFDRLVARAVGLANEMTEEDVLNRRWDAWEAGTIDPFFLTPTVGASPPPIAKVSLKECHATFRRWLGDEYDLDILDACLAAIAVEQLDGDPVWLLVVSGSGNAKTETAQSLSGAGAEVTSTITSVGALLSAVPPRKGRPATGGLLRRLGHRGVLVIKDVTSILSMDRNVRGQVLAALREVYDGFWERNVGSDGGQSIGWRGRIVVIGAVTTAWDTHHDVVTVMGDRFVLLRPDSATGRVAAGRRSVRNTGTEVRMREELAEAVAGVLAGADLETPQKLTDDQVDRLLAAADLVTQARTAVDVDYRGDVIDAHAPEMPTRFVKQLVQVVRGGVAVGMTRVDAMRLALRCARDSMPPLRLAILGDLAKYPASTLTEVRRRVDHPRMTVDRQLQSLHALRLLTQGESVTPLGTKWVYSLASGINPVVLDDSCSLCPEK
jgi:hypothetical protein